MVLRLIPPAAVFGDARWPSSGGVAFALVALAVLAVRPVWRLRHAT